MATYFSIPAWEIPRTEEPGGLQSMGLHRVGHDRAINSFSDIRECILTIKDQLYQILETALSRAPCATAMTNGVSCK